MPPKPSRDMTDESRAEMTQKLQDDLEDFVAERSKEAIKNKKNAPEDTRSTDEIWEELKNHPCFLKEIDYTKPLPPEIEGLMALKYESEDPVASAISYKEDGNEEFKKKKYKISIANYTEGITIKCPDKEVNAVLYTNRAAAQFHIKNYRTSFNDCIFARKFKPDHVKAITRGAHCSSEMRRYGDCIRWCDAVLMMEPENSAILKLRVDADKGLRAQERDARKKAAQERREEEEDNKLLKTIQDRGVSVASLKVDKDSKINPLLLTALESHNPSGAKVHLDKEGTLHWPVIFFYPEHAQTDFISAFDENACFCDHLSHMFSTEAPPASWDLDSKYKPQDIEIFFENIDEEKLYKINSESSLLAAIRHKKYKVYAGTPGFILIVRGSKFAKEFFTRYSYKMT